MAGLRLIGRERELARIRDALADARRSVGGCLVISGEAGIGKSALLAAVHTEALDTTGPPFAVLETRGVQSDAELPFVGLLELVRPVVPLLGRLPERQRDALEVALAMAAGGDRADRLTLGAATLNLLATASAPQPLLVLVDDAHWLDAASIDALAFAARRLRSDSIVMLVTVRSGERSVFTDGGFELLRLEPLTLAQASQLLAGRSTGVVDADRLSALYELTSGNPLGLLELDAVALPPPSDSPFTALTPRLTQAFLARVEILSPQARTAAVVAAASLTGSGAAVLAAVRSLELPDTSLEDCERAGLFVLVDGRITFHHPLVRTAVYTAAPADERRRARRALADALSNDPSPAVQDERAWHLAASAPGADEAAAAALDDAADRARRRGSLPAVAAALRRAAELSTDPRRRATRLLAAAEATLLMGRHAEAAELLTGLSELDGYPDLLASVQRLRTQLELLRSSPLQIHAQLAQFAASVEPADPAQAVTMLVTAAGAAAMGGDVRACLDAAERAVTVAARCSTELEQVSAALYAHGLLLAGNRLLGERYLRSAYGYFQDRDPLDFGAEVFGFLALDLLWVEDWHAGRKLIQMATERFRAVAAPERLVVLLAVQAELELRTGRWDAAVASATESAQLGNELSQPTSEAYALATLAWVAAHRGDRAACDGSVNRGLRLLEGLGVELVTPYVRVAAATNEMLADAGAGADALGAVRDGLRAAGAVNPAVLQYDGDLIEACWQAGRLDVARASAADLRSRLDDAPSQWGSAVLARVEALMQPSEDAFARAEADAMRADVFTRARVQLAHGAWLRRTNARGRARALLPDALSTFAALGARPWAERTERELHASGAKRASPPARANLTAQELQVAQRVAEGATNAEVAQSLYVSVKTIESHLGRVYTKLGVRSRTQMARRLRELSVV